jgi:hypothetical protein
MMVNLVDLIGLKDAQEKRAAHFWVCLCGYLWRQLMKTGRPILNMGGALQ